MTIEYQYLVTANNYGSINYVCNTDDHVNMTIKILGPPVSLRDCEGMLTPESSDIHFVWNKQMCICSIYWPTRKQVDLQVTCADQ